MRRTAMSPTYCPSLATSPLNQKKQNEVVIFRLRVDCVPKEVVSMPLLNLHLGKERTSINFE